MDFVELRIENEQNKNQNKKQEQKYTRTKHQYLCRINLLNITKNMEVMAATQLVTEMKLPENNPSEHSGKYLPLKYLEKTNSVDNISKDHDKVCEVKS